MFTVNEENEREWTNVKLHESMNVYNVVANFVDGSNRSILESRYTQEKPLHYSFALFFPGVDCSQCKSFARNHHEGKAFTKTVPTRIVQSIVHSKTNPSTECTQIGEY